MTSCKEGEVGFSGATMVLAVEEGASEGAASGFEDGRVAVAGAVSRSSYMGFLSCRNKSVSANLYWTLGTGTLNDVIRTDLYDSGASASATRGRRAKPPTSREAVTGAACCENYSALARYLESWAGQLDEKWRAHPLKQYSCGHGDLSG